MNAVTQLHRRDYFPKWKGAKPTKRPYRIYAAKTDGWRGPKVGKDLPGRRYETTLRAHDQALLLVRWEKEGTVFEVYDIRNGSLIGVYKRMERSVDFTVIKGGA